MSSKRCPKVDKDGFTLVESKRTKKKEVAKESLTFVSPLHTNRNDRDRDDSKFSTYYQDGLIVNSVKKTTTSTTAVEKAKMVKSIQESKEIDKKKELSKVNAPSEIGTKFNLPKSYSEISAAQTDIKQKSEFETNFVSDFLILKI